MVYYFVYLTLIVLLATLVIYSIIECKKLDKYLNLRTQLPTSQTPDPSVAISTPKSSAPATPTYNSMKFSSSYFSSQPLRRPHLRATYWQFYQQILLLSNKTCLSITSQQDAKYLIYLALHNSLICFCPESESLMPQTYYSVTQNNTIMIILILPAIFAKARLNSIMGLVKPAFRNSNKFSASFVSV